MRACSVKGVGMCPLLRAPPRSIMARPAKREWESFVFHWEPPPGPPKN